MRDISLALSACIDCFYFSDSDKIFDYSHLYRQRPNEIRHESHPFQLRLRRTQPRADAADLSNSMFALHEIGENVPYRYSRLSNPTRQVLEDTVADLEHGAAGFAFSSGMAGIDAVWRTFLRPGDTIVAVADIYGGAYDLLVDVYQKWGVNVVFADLGNPDNLDELLKAHNVKLVCWNAVQSAFALGRH